MAVISGGSAGPSKLDEMSSISRAFSVTIRLKSANEMRARASRLSSA